ncbi:branched-chain amino acid transport system II carrier protein [Loigolactobacillus iwatensis]|uniref:branched-chain amino acid transport system II carrier protein n=1 Tax=Loigolactobacillus iwatensis TaxID=1267156 RepID=UPI000F7E512E|nr:branched-chain amino acid transport system II carrier protein [Loigolactobacillus iwatensis]
MELEQKERRLTWKNYLMIGSMLFGMFFGAGNLIFPLHLGQLAGNHWGLATIGFLLSGTLLPLLSIIAISITRSEGIYDVARPIGKHYALIFLILVHATLGPLFATPRTATVPFELGIAPHIPAGQTSLYLAIYSAIFFLITYRLSSRQSRIIDVIGRLLNPLFLILLAIIFLFAFLSPMGQASHATATTAYTHGALTNGFLQGYNTMDALAGLAFGVTVVTSIKLLGTHKPKNIALATAKSGALSMGIEALIYLALILIGATSLNQFKLSANGGIVFAQIANHYMGAVGDAILATLATVTCITTAMGLVTAFAQDFHKHFPKISYLAFLRFTCGISFLIANIGLTQIIAWSTPVLMFLYPLAITLIILAILSPLFKQSSFIYRVTTIFTLIPAIFDMIHALPPLLAQTAFARSMTAFATHYLPLFKLGFDWIPFAAVGFLIGIGGYALRNISLNWHLNRQNLTDENDTDH